MKKTVDSVVTKIFKIALSDVFKEKRSKLKSFLLQIKMNIYFNELQFKINTDKVLYTVIYLRDYDVK